MLAARGAVFQMKQAGQDAPSESLGDMWPICRAQKGRNVGPGVQELVKNLLLDKSRKPCRDDSQGVI